MRAAAHGASFDKARKIRASMPPGTLKDFEHLAKGAPKRVKKAR